MKTEEKAKKYDEALEWMRELYPGLHGATKEDAEHYFPELKEIENERIIRAIIDALYSHNNSINLLSSRGYQMEDIKAWLEKQKEASKAIETVEKIDKYIDEHLANAHDMKDSEYYHGWDDALGKMAGILQDIYSEEKQKEQPQEELVYRMNGLMQEYIKEGEDDAEKEHRLKCYQLFWDALEDADFFVQKEQKPLEYLSKEKVFAIMNKLTSLSFCVPLGSDEEKKIHEITCDVSSLLDYPIEQKPAVSRKETLYQLFQNGLITLSDYLYLTEEQKSAEWSKEDEDTYNRVYCLFRDAIDEWYKAIFSGCYPKITKDKVLAMLKSLKDRGNFPKSNTNSLSEWSEEDEAMRNNILCFLSSFVGTSECDSNPSLSTSYPAYQKEIDWLKSLRPQPHWKPSEEQMEALSETIAFAPDTFKPKCTLVTLQDDLKNL